MNLIPFNFNGRQVRVIVDEHGEPWFIAMEVSDILGYSDTYEMTKRLDEDEKQNRQIAGFGPRGVSTISEPGLYTAVFGSSKSEARAFKRWVTHDVLPQIRKTGSYQQPMSQAEYALVQAQIMVGFEQEQRRQQVELQRLGDHVGEHEQRLEDLSHSRVWEHCPQNCLSLTGVKEAMRERYGLSGAIVDFILKQWQHLPNPAGMVRNGHEDAKGSQYMVWSKTMVTASFRRFVSECQMVTSTQAEHPDIEGRFQLRLKGSV